MGRKATAGVITMILIGAVVACSDPTSIYSPLDSLPSPDGKASAVTGAEIRGSTGRYAVSLLKNSEESDDTTVFIATVPGKSDFGILRKKPLVRVAWKAPTELVISYEASLAPERTLDRWNLVSIRFEAVPAVRWEGR